jgi:hypothetical protein
MPKLIKGLLFVTTIIWMKPNIDRVSIMVEGRIEALDTPKFKKTVWGRIHE